MATAMADDGKLICLDQSKEWTDIGRKYWKEAKVDHKIDLRLGNAATLLGEILN